MSGKHLCFWSLDYFKTFCMISWYWYVKSTTILSIMHPSPIQFMLVYHFIFGCVVTYWHLETFLFHLTHSELWGITPNYFPPWVVPPRPSPTTLCCLHSPALSAACLQPLLLLLSWEAFKETHFVLCSPTPMEIFSVVWSPRCCCKTSRAEHRRAASTLVAC